MTLAEVKAWVAAAKADGWSCEGTYEPNESVEHAATLKRDGFHVLTIMRSETQASISAWGPDELHIEVPVIYDFDELRAGVNRCGYCGDRRKPTVRIGFAGRCCQECREKNVEFVETTGWYN